MSHDTDLIIQHDEKIKDDKRKKRKRKNKKKDSKVASESCSSPQGKRSHFEGAELDQAVPMSEPALPEHQETARAEPADATHAFEPGETASKNGNEESQPEAPAEAPDRPKVKKVEGGTHRAGFDAFMTGYIFAYARNLTKNTEESSTAPLVPTCLNKLFLSGKSVPLHVVKSTFSKSSKAHMLKMEYVWGKSTAVEAEGNA